MRVSSHSLAGALAERIGAILPLGISIRAVGSSLDLYADERWLGSNGAASILDDTDDRVFRERVETIGRAVLSGVQDLVVDELTTQWPSDAEGKMVMAGARTAAGRIYLWYGSSETDAVVTLQPIELGELGEG
jgi:hypothetical protein